jgi:hypothetical protein
MTTSVFPPSVQGDVANDAVDSGLPIKIGGKINTGIPSGPSNGDRVDAWMGTHGQVVVTYGTNQTAADGITAGSIQRARAVSGSDGLFAIASWVFNGTSWDRIRSGGITGMLGVGGDVAHDSPDSTSNPQKIGGKASSSLPAAVAASDRVDALFDLVGRQVIAAKSATAALSNVAGSASNVTLLAANVARLGATIFNDSSAILYVKMGATASVTSYTVQIAAGGYYELPYGYTGLIDGLWASATGNARITELT